MGERFHTNFVSAKVNRLLVLVDVPLQDWQALTFAIKWARHEGGIIHLLHVVDDGPFAYDALENPLQHTPEHCEQAARRYLRLLARREIPMGISVEVTTRRGNTARQVAQVAKEIHASMIALCDPHRNWFTRWMCGDSIRRIEMRAPCSVVVLRKGERGESRHPAQVAAPINEHLTP